MTGDQLEDLLKLAIRAAGVAGEAVMEIYKSDEYFVERKSDNSPLTKADAASHNEIKRLLGSTGLPILSEEGKEIPYGERKNWIHFWLVDPLDGTKEFISRNGEFAINIALIAEGRPVLGVICVPVSGEIFHATGAGAFKTSGGVTTRLTRRDSVDFSRRGLRVIASRSHNNKETSEFIESLNEPELVSVGSSLKFILLAENRADIYPRLAPTMEWDTAAGQVLVEQTGGQVLIDRQRTPLTYNKESLVNPHFLSF